MAAITEPAAILRDALTSLGLLRMRAEECGARDEEGHAMTICRPSHATERHNCAAAAPKGLAAVLGRGETPDALERIPIEGKVLMIFQQ
jgi:hypothetical protein